MRHLGVPRFHSSTTHKGKKQKRQENPTHTEQTSPCPSLHWAGVPCPSLHFLLLNAFTHLDFPLSLAPPRFPVSPGFGGHYSMLTYIQDTSERDKVCSQLPPWSLNSKGYFLSSHNLNLSPHNFEGKSFSGQIPAKC